MATIADLLIKLGIEDTASAGLTKFGAKADEAGAKTSTFGSKVSGASHSVVGSVGKIVAAAGVMGGAFAAGEWLKGSIESAENLTKAQDGLSLAIEKTGGNATKLAPQLDAVAKSAAQYGIDQVTATQGLQKAVLIAGSAAAGMRAYREAVAISKATGQDFNAVLLATSKGQQGITTSLQRYGIAVAKGTPGQKQLGMVMKTFGGQAAANTTVSDQLRARLENLQASVGQKLLPIFDKFIGILDDTVTWLTTAASWVKRNWDYIAPFAAAIGAVVAAYYAWKVATAIWTAVTELATGAQEALNLALEANPIGVVILALVALGAALVVLWNKSNTFRDIVLGVWGAIKDTVTTVVNAVVGAVTGAWDKVKAVTDTVVNFVRDHWRLLVTILAGILTGGLGTIVALIATHWGQVKATTVAAWDAIKGAVSSAVNAVQSVVMTVFNALEGIVKGAVKGVRAGIGLFRSAFQPVLDVLHAIERAAGTAFSAIDKVMGIGSKIGGLAHSAGSFLSSINPFASGTLNAPGGLALVGENGPELVNLPASSRVHTNSETSRMLAGAGGGGNTIHVENMNVRSDEDVRLWARDLARRLGG